MCVEIVFHEHAIMSLVRILRAIMATEQIFCPELWSQTNECLSTHEG